MAFPKIFPVLPEQFEFQDLPTYFQIPLEDFRFCKPKPRWMKATEVSLALLKLSLFFVAKASGRIALSYCRGLSNCRPSTPPSMKKKG